MAQLSRADLATHLPHGGAMRLLDRVLSWDESGITCTASSHRAPGNPLRDGGTLPAVAGLEYAAQAMAVHVSLTTVSTSAESHHRIGLLGSARDVEFFTARLDQIPGPLTIEAALLLREPAGHIYRFRIAAEGRDLLRGRASIFLRP